jgi:hypothetical protein
VVGSMGSMLVDATWNALLPAIRIATPKMINARGAVR